MARSGHLVESGLFITCRRRRAALDHASKVPETRNPQAGRLDVAGALLAAAGLGALVFGLIEAPTADGPMPASGVASRRARRTGVFVAVERRSRHPMVPLNLFRNRTFTAANLLTSFSAPPSPPCSSSCHSSLSGARVRRRIRAALLP
jgi:hypothetical protein